MNSVRKYFAILASLSFLFAAINLSAQNKKDNSWKSKLKQVKGDVQKIVITTEDGETTFEGQAAKEMLKRIKRESKREMKVEFIGDDDSDGENVYVIKVDYDEDGEHHLGKDLVWVTESDDDSLNASTKMKINVEVENGEKEVTVTTTKDGKEYVKTYKGKEADEFLKKHNGKNFNIQMMGKGKHGNTFFFNKKNNKKGHKLWIQSDDDSDGINKNVEVEKKDGKLKVTVTTTKNGEEDVKVYEGEDAEKYLEENNDNAFEFDTDGDAGNIIIIRECDTDKSDNDCTKLKSKKIKVKIIKEKKNDDD